MKKFILPLTLALVLIFSLGACGKSDKNIDIDKLCEQALSEGKFNDELITLPDKVLPDYYTLPDGIEEYRIYVSSSSATASEFAIFKCKDDSAVKDMLAAISKRMEEQVENYQDYRPDEFYRLQNAVITNEGNYVMFAVADNADALKKLFQDSAK